MALTAAQIVTLKADITANSDLTSLPSGPDGAFAVAALYSLPASPVFTVWKSKLTEVDIVSLTSGEVTTWSWTAYINRTQGERDGWSRMFSITGYINPALAQTQQAILDIFSGTGAPAIAQRVHLAAIGKRNASRIEKLFATGTGSLASPATMQFEGQITYTDVQTARGF